MNVEKPSKEFKEKRIGDLFVEMGFVTQGQLKEALKVAKERNVKVGEALCSMGILDKDHIYWVLSNQLKMNYIELSSEMIDEKLIKRSSIDILEQLHCVPLFEEGDEVHLALADPTDQGILEKVKTLNPGKSVQVHLALPDKITETLAHFRRRMTPGEDIGPMEKHEKNLTAGPIEFSKDANAVHSWSDLADLLLSMPREDVYWLYSAPGSWRLISQRDENFKTMSEYSEEVYALIKEQIEKRTTSRPYAAERILFLQDKPTLRQSLFKLWQMSSFGREMIRIERIPTFLEEEFLRLNPQASQRMEDLGHLLNYHPRILIGGKNSLFIKQCCYSVLGVKEPFLDFPPRLFVENEIQIYLPGVAQLPSSEFTSLTLLDRLDGMFVPFIFYEAEFSEAVIDERFFSRISSGTYSTVILYCPFASLESMKKTLFTQQDWRQAGFEAAFFSEYELKSI